MITDKTLTRGLWVALVLAVLGLGLSMVAAPKPALAAVTCETDFEWFTAEVARQGGRIIAIAEYDGIATDMTVVYSAAGILYAMGFRDGCKASPPLSLDILTEPTGTPAPAAAPAVLHSSAA